MPSVTVNMGVATRTLVTEKRNATVKPSLLVIDNVLGAVDAILTLNDVFTPAITNGVALPVLTTVARLRINIPAGICQSLEDELKDIKFLGTVNIVRGVLDANCLITFAYALV